MENVLEREDSCNMGEFDAKNDEFLNEFVRFALSVYISSLVEKRTAKVRASIENKFEKLLMMR